MSTLTTSGETSFTKPSDLELVMTRAFAAPRAVVYAAWTRPEHVRQWLLGPDGWSMPVCEIDLRPGGGWHFVWRKEDDGSEMEMRGEYRDVRPPTLLINTESWGGDWPETLSTLSLAEEAGRTILTQTIRYPTREARDAVLQTGMEQGVQRSFERLDDYLRRIGDEEGAPQSPAFHTAPQREHQWLQRLVGDWVMESDEHDAGNPPEGVAWHESVRSIADIWVVGEGGGPMPDGSSATTLITLGFDPQTQRFVGTWIGSMMHHLWVYDGVLSDDGNTLTLNTTGPDMQVAGATRQYQDIITFTADDRRVLTARVLGKDGNWEVMMTARYRRSPT
jgi:uncharacterized protein YndB with AHSA1/START domain